VFFTGLVVQFTEHVPKSNQEMLARQTTCETPQR